MRRCHLHALILFGTLCGGAAGADTAAAAQLLEVSLSTQPLGTTVTLSLSDRVAQRIFTLANPHRIVIDLPDTGRVPGLHLPAADGAVEQLRLGPRPNHGLRLVLQLATGLKAAVRSERHADAYQLQLRLGAAGAGLARATATATVAASTPRVPQPVRAAHAPTMTDRDIVIAVDAGHGGEDPGASGRGGTHEKDVVLAIARALAARIDHEPGMRAVLTRDGDYFIPLRERMQRARAAHADMFVSVHADAVRDREVSGASVYTLSAHGATSEAAHWLAERENAADLKGGVSLADKNGELASV
ncbi:MAG: N-acetylmuramoyl-L-alanine amidase, partial [Steroidobacterales bacterium]